MPLFLTYPAEGAVIGRLLAGYGELEYHMAECLSDHVHDEDTAFRLMFKIRLSEKGRIDAMNSLVRAPLAQLGLGTQYADAYGAVKRCAEIRNQYAHCHWTENYEKAAMSGGDEYKRSLAFVKLEQRYQTQTTKDIITRELDLELLLEQEKFFCDTSDCFRFIHHETRLRRGELPRPHPFEMPKKLTQPDLHR